MPTELVFNGEVTRLWAPKEDRAAALAPLVFAVLGDAKWHTRKELAARISGLTERVVRIIAERSDGAIIGGQQGYRLTKYATSSECVRAERWLHSQGRKMIQRALDIRKARHARG